MTNRDDCPAVERTPGMVSGAWVFAGTRISLSALDENLAGGATVEDFVAWFAGVDANQVRTVLEHEARAVRSAPARCRCSSIRAVAVGEANLPVC